jgi:hypothetical protein
MKKLLTTLIFVLCVGVTYPQEKPQFDFSSEIEEYTREVISYWKRGEQIKLNIALGKLVKFSIMSVELNHSNLRTNILSRIPQEVEAKSIPPFIFFLDMKDRGINLHPASFFEGRAFPIIGATTMEDCKK